MSQSDQDSRAWRLFKMVTDYPKTLIILSLALVLIPGSFIVTLTRNTAAEAFMPDDHPAVVYRNRVKELFGLKDPMVVAVINREENGIFNPHSLQLISWLTEEAADIDGVDPDRITSLATENDIIGTEFSMIVEPFFESPPETQEEADQVREAVMDFALYADNLVGSDGAATFIIIETLSSDESDRVYADILALTRRADTKNEELHVAGIGAVSGYLGTYIDRDAQRLNPFSALVISIILFIAYRNARGVLLPNLLVIGAVLITVGIMAFAGLPFYIITNALPVILIAIAVADGIHIMGQYYEELIHHPDDSQQTLVIRTMCEMWRPVTYTSISDIAGFMAIFAASFMPPMKWFGLFASVGVAAALVLSLFTLPAVLVLLKPKGSKAFRKDGYDPYGQAMGLAGQWVIRRSGLVLILAAVLIVVGVVGAGRLETNEEWVTNFQPDDPIYIADRAINETLNGTYFLDVVVESSEPDGLFEPETLAKMEALQDYLETLPHVTNTTSIVDIIKQMNRAVNEDRPESFTIPDDIESAAQLFFLYEISGDPSDLEEYIDSDHQFANIRASVNSGLNSDETVLVDQVRKYIEDNFNTPELTASLSGNVNVDYYWLKTLSDGHFRSVGLALLAVCIMAILSFRSVTAGVIAIVPVSIAVFMLYAVMGYVGIWLSVGTSMFAAVAIGTGVDFAIHTIDRMIALIREQNHTIEEAFMQMFPSTGRALLFSFAGLCLGFLVLTTSQVPSLARFGALVGVGATASFLASMTVLPALLNVLKPKFLFGPTDSNGIAKAGAAAVLCLCLLAPGSVAAQSDLPDGKEIAEKVNARDDGISMYRGMTMELINKKGKVRERVTHGFRKYFGDEKRTVIFYDSPKNVRGTGFLVYDYPDKDDDQWLYLPAMRKVRRISAADRGDYFLGTDFTYEDMKNETKVVIKDYTWTTTGMEEVDGKQCYVIESMPVNEKIGKELGYSKVRWWVDPEIWMGRKAEYWDTKGNHLKTMYIRDIREIQGILTVMKMEMENHKTGNKTVFTFSDVDYKTDVDDDIFTERALRRGK